MKFIKKNLFAIVLLIIVISIPLLSFAQGLTGDAAKETTTIVNPIPKISDINGLIKTILEAVVKIGIPIVALAIIYCGFLFVKALGKPEELKKAKDALLYTVIGSAILLGAWTIAQLISDTVIEIGK